MLSWKVFWEDFNKREIVYYDIFKNGYWEEKAKELKKKHPNFGQWTTAFRIQLMSQYWSRSEYEVIITSWPPYIETKELDRLCQEREEREKVWGSKILRINPRLTTTRKIDIFEQLDMNWEVFTNYVWNNI